MAQTDREALIALHRSTDGPNWKKKTNWNTDTELSDWYGVTVNEGRVVGLYLAAYNLRGISRLTLRASHLVLLRCLWRFLRIR